MKDTDKDKLKQKIENHFNSKLPVDSQTISKTKSGSNFATGSRTEIWYAYDEVNDRHYQKTVIVDNNVVDEILTDEKGQKYERPIFIISRKQTSPKKKDEE